MRAITVTFLASVAFAGAAISSCTRAPVLNVVDARVRLSATPKGPAAAYFTVKGGPAEDRLMSVSSPMVIRTELHETIRGGGAMMSMKPIMGGQVIPAGGAVSFAPGGKHAMLFNVNPVIQPPRTLQLTFTFASGSRILADAVVRRAGDPE